MDCRIAVATVIALTSARVDPPSATEVKMDPVGQWNIVALDAIRELPPTAQTRELAMVHAAMFDAMNGVDRRFDPYLVDLRPAGRASGPAALASAALTVLAALHPERRPAFDAALVATLIAVKSSGAEREQGLAFGRLVGAAVLSHRKDDGSRVPPSRQAPGVAATQSSASDLQPAVGVWRPTPPGHVPPLAPHWGEVRPFLIAEPAHFAPPPPPAITSARYSQDFAEVQTVGSADSARRSPDQTAAAVFWTGYAPAIWSSAARQALARRPGLSLLERARVFALLTGGMNDAAVVGWAAKYHYRLWRPVTAIRLAATDGNDATQTDPAWEPLVLTPPFPCYVSGHAIIAGAAERLLTAVLGADRAELAITVADVGVTRRYSSFSQLAREALDARIWGGVHFRASQEEGLRAGRRIGEAIVGTRLQPIQVSHRRSP